MAAKEIMAAEEIIVCHYQKDLRLPAQPRYVLDLHGEDTDAPGRSMYRACKDLTRCDPYT